MQRSIALKRAACGALLLGLVAVVLSACGSSSNTATSLLEQTFTGTHAVNSGNLALNLTVNPSGSSTFTGPISIRFGGPFQSMGQGKVPKSNFSVSFSAGGKSASLGILSTGTAGYITFQGASYKLPAATFQKLESSFAGLTASPTSKSGASALTKLGIHPLKWLINPRVVGKETMAGTETTHIRSGVNVPAFLNDVNTLLQKASSLGATGSSGAPSSLSAATRQAIAKAVQNPTVDVWTGSSDKTVRRLSIQLTVALSGQLSTSLGGLRSAQIGLTMQYSNLNQPQIITAPTNPRPFSEFSSRLQSLLGTLQGSLGTGTTSSGSSSGVASGSAGGSAQAQSYGQCIENAQNDIAKMQKCASLINGK